MTHGLEGRNLKHIARAIADILDPRRTPFPKRLQTDRRVVQTSTRLKLRAMPTAPHLKKSRPTANGISQLSLVEHSLCPLDPETSLKERFSHDCKYRFTDPKHGRSIGHARVAAYEGLSAHDEFYLWGLLGITFAQPHPEIDLHVTPHYCLRQFGMLTTKSKGGESYRLLRESLRRLSAIRYRNDRFYDPLRREHREVSFGFFSYSLPVDPESSRAWRIVWDPLFFEMCQAAGSQLGFDLGTYRELDPASRRLFLLLKKIFYRRESSPWFDLRQLAVDVLGFSPQLELWRMKQKVQRAADALVREGIIAPELSRPWWRKRAKGVHAVQFHRGPNIDVKKTPRKVEVSDSPLYDPLRSIGFDENSISQILRGYSPDLVKLWSDVTLMAIERREVRFFRRSPQAFFWDNLRAADAGKRAAPDWFLTILKTEERHESERQRKIRVADTQQRIEVGKQTIGRAIEPSEVQAVVNAMLGRAPDGE